MKGIVVLVLICGIVGAAFGRPDLNAFLNKKAGTIQELVQQVRSDRTVMDRYCRHYQMTPAEVIAHLKTLRPGTIKREDVFTIYSVPVDGHIKCHLERLPVGTRVYLGPDGKPELIAKCGNPLRAPTPKVDVDVDVVSKFHENLQDLESNPVFTAEIVPPSAEEPGLLDVVPDTPVEEIVTGGDSAIPIVGMGSTALLFPLGLFAATIHNNPTSDTPGPAAAIPFIVGFGAYARIRRARRRGR